MTYIFLAVAALVFVMGMSGTASLFSVLADVKQRRSLLGRVAGFFAMSAWLHAVPSMLAVVYMRQEGLLAAELLTHDDARATVVGLFVLPLVALLTLAASWGAIWSSISGVPWRILSLHTLGGVFTALYILGMYALQIKSLTHGFFLLILVVPLALYVSIALTAPLDKQIKLYWLPFAVVLAVSLTLILGSASTHRMVADELRRFGVGGGKWVVAKTKELEIEGRLVLMTDKAVYVREMLDFQTASDCVIKLPAEHTVVATTDVTPMERAYGTFTEGERRVIADVLVLPDYSSVMAARGKAAAKSTQLVCKSELGAQEWARANSMKNLSDVTFSEKMALAMVVLGWLSPDHKALAGLRERSAKPPPGLGTQAPAGATQPGAR